METVTSLIHPRHKCPIHLALFLRVQQENSSIFLRCPKQRLLSSQGQK
jgi:hypothetical protein